MWANEKQSWEEMKQPGDWMRTFFYQTDEEKIQPKVPAGITMICVCGDQISLSNTIHTFESYDPLTISPSIGHYDNDARHVGERRFKCHYFVKNGEYVQA